MIAECKGKTGDGKVHGNSEKNRLMEKENKKKMKLELVFRFALFSLLKKEKTPTSSSSALV